MGLLGNFLESFYGSGHQFQTVRASVRGERTESSRGESSRRPPIGREKSRSPKVTTLRLDFWAIMPNRARVDSTNHDGDAETKVEVVVGAERFRRLRDGSVELSDTSERQRGSSDALPTEFRRHFDRSLIREFFTSLVLEDQGACEVAGRACVQIRGVPVPDDRLWPHWLPAEADEFVFAADLEFPSLLSITGKLAGAVIETLAVIDVRFNEAIDEQVFDCRATSGQAVRKREPIAQQMSMQTAKTKVAFTILVPKGMATGIEPHVHYEPGSGRPSGESIGVMYIGGGPHRLWYNLRAAPDPELSERLEWEVIEAAGRQFEVSDPETDRGMIVVRFCQDGTWVEVHSDHPLDELLEIAASFEAVTA